MLQTVRKISRFEHGTRLVPVRRVGVCMCVLNVFCFAHLGRQGQNIRDHRRDAVRGSSLQEGRPPNVVVVVVVVARRVQVAETARQRRRFVQAQRNTVTR